MSEIADSKASFEGGLDVKNRKLKKQSTSINYIGLTENKIAKIVHCVVQSCFAETWNV